MKKILFLLFISSISYCQVTVTGLSGFNDSPYNSGNVQYQGTAPNSDVGSNSYSNNYVDFFVSNWVRRYNNRWQIGSSWNIRYNGSPTNGHNVYYETIDPIVNPDPPCSSYWREVSNGTQVGNPILLTLTGDCIPANAHTLMGNLKYDLNNDNCATSNYHPNNILLNSTASGTSNNYSSSSDLNGDYIFRFYETGSVTTNITSLGITTINPTGPPSYTNNWPVAQTTISNQDYCIKSNLTGDDVIITLIPLSEVRPGRENKFKILYTNLGANPVDGDITFNYNNNYMGYANPVNPPSNSTINSLTWAYTGLRPLETKVQLVSFTMFPPPTVRGGDINVITAQNNLIGTDINPSNNTFSLNQTVVNSYDPNDVTILEGREITAAQALTDLNFRIRFQNTGTASAIDIKVKTTLDADLDWATFLPISSSHSYTSSISGSDVTFSFNDINLPDSTTNGPDSHGYILFKAKPKNSFTIGNKIESQADIYFDFNAAVVTNTAITEIPAPVSTNNSATILPDRISFPRMSNTAIQNLPNPEAGTVVFDVDNLCLKLYNGTSWSCL